MTDCNIRLYRIKYTGETIIGRVEKNNKDQISLKEAVMPVLIPQGHGEGNTSGLTFIPVSQFGKVKDKITIHKEDCILWNEEVDPQIENMYRSIYGKVVLPDPTKPIDTIGGNVINLK